MVAVDRTGLPGCADVFGGLQQSAGVHLVEEVHAANLGYLPKPVKPAALRALINSHLAG
nr:hypothetical protein [Pseudomonas pohangensis]